VTALYRKCRPQGFDDVVGQEPVVRTLRNAVAAGNVRQAYLFGGISLFATGLSRKQKVTKAKCKTCGNEWVF
jgi:DNA polymerase III gamma/tau subunit